MKNCPILLLLAITGLMLTGCDKEEDDQPNCDPFTVDLGEDRTIQEGEAVVLEETVEGATYLWSTGETANSITVDTTGVYWLKVTTCYGTQSDTVMVEISYPTIIIETGLGNIQLWLYHETPLHKANFLDLVGQHYYQGVIFHRVVENFVIQGGDPTGTGTGGPGYTLPAEIISSLNHTHGAVGAARLPDNVNPEKESHGSQFYIVSDPNGEPSLNGDYTVFGIVFNGLETVMEISQVEVDGNDRPIEDVIMEEVTVVYYTAAELFNNFDFEVH